MRNASSDLTEPDSRQSLDPALSRRQVLLMAGSLALAPVRAASPSPTLLAAWQDQDEQHIGLLQVAQHTWSVQHSLKVPTRAHGLRSERGASVLAVARRPGDWLLRWHPASGQTQWQWADDDRRFNGHVITSAAHRVVWTTETDLDNAQGLLGVRDAQTLEKTDEWPTSGMDPHQLLTLPQPMGPLPAGTLMVANGGIPTLPETGRSKRAIGRMDSSLVALHPTSGELIGQWRLADPFLSIRHLAWDPMSRTLGIALQAEHPDTAEQAGAAVLAVCNGTSLQAAQAQPPLAGYGGDICALPEGGFAVSCPRANRLALFGPQARWRSSIEHSQAYALASHPNGWWLASAQGHVGVLQGDTQSPSPRRILPRPNRQTPSPLIDNHWTLVSG